MLKNIIFDISKLNTDDDIGIFSSGSEYEIFESLSEFTPDKGEAFLITDSRDKADRAKELGIGFAVYLNGMSSEENFSDALYCVDKISDTSDKAIYNMYLRYKGLPWTIIEKEKYLVREVTLDDIDELYEIYSDEDTKRYIEDLYPEKEHEITFLKEYIANQYRFFEYGVWVVIDREKGRLVGRAGLSDRVGFDNVELGFIFKKEYWGSGIALEVCSDILDYAYENFGFEKIISFTMPENIRAIKFLEKLGFSFDGMENIDLGTFRKYSYYHV